MNGNASVSQYI